MHHNSGGRAGASGTSPDPAPAYPPSPAPPRSRAAPVNPPWPPDYSMSNSIQSLFLRLDPAHVARLAERIQAAVEQQGLVYEEADGSSRPIPVLMRPRLMDERQLAYFRRIGNQMNRAFARLGRLLLAQPRLRALFDFSEAEWEWVDRYLPGCVSSDPDLNPEQDALLVRWDANTTFSGRRWRGGFHFFEANGVGAGGLHYGPAVEEIIETIIIPELAQLDRRLILKRSDDSRRLLELTLLRHARSLGVPQPRVGMVLETRIAGGPVEFEQLSRYLRAHGVANEICDARDLVVSNGVVRAPGGPIDLVYRDTQLSELIDYQAAGEPLTALRQLFAGNRVVSNMIGELDQKSCLEIFTDPDLVGLFDPAEQQVFRRHVLWTRLLGPRRTTGPDGSSIDLLPHVAAERQRYVIKPNREFGGRGVMIGSRTETATWQGLIELAAREPGKLVVQDRAVVSRKRFPVLTDRGELTEVSLHVVCSFFLTRDGIGLIGRAGAAPVVNVAQKGGMTALLVCGNR